MPFPEFNRATKPPLLAPPPGSWDCQVHLYGDAVRYPPKNPHRMYDPPSTTLADLERMHDTLGIAHAVIVQATTYGTDHSLLLDTLRAAAPGRYSGVAIIDDSVTDRDLRVLHEAGVRAARFNFWAKLGIAPSIPTFERSLARIAELGWHAKIHATPPELVELHGVLQRVQHPCVLDHMGHLPLRDGMQQPAFGVIQDLLAHENWWILLSNGDRNSVHDTGWDDAVPFGRAYHAMAPGRCIWCTDWPHVAYEKATTPDDGALLDLLRRFLPDEAALRQVLVDNPRRLFGVA